MKYSFSLLAIAALLAGRTATAQGPIAPKNMGGAANTTIHASLQGLHAGRWVYWTYFGKDAKDSVRSVEGGFTIHTHIEPGEGTLYWLQVGNGQSAPVILYFDKGEHYMKGTDSTFNNITLSGASYDKDYNDYEAQVRLSPILRAKDSLLAAARIAYGSKDTVAQHRLLPLFKANDSVQAALDLAWVLKHPASPFSTVLIFQSVRGHQPDSLTAPIVAAMDTNALHNHVGKALLKAMDIAGKTAIGRPSMNFTQPDSTGKEITLGSFKGKYVLLDFWASWCGPCRAENPNVKANYEKYKDKNFTVLGVSLDGPGDKARWLKAVAADGLPWTQVSDLKGWNNAAAMLYDIKAIPANFLLDPNGVIIGKNLRGDELSDKLKEVFATQAPNFTITGKIGSMDKPAKVYLDYSDGNGGGGVDSSDVVNGAFSFSGYTAGISTARMSLDHTGEGKQAAIYKGGDNIYFYFAGDHMNIRSADSLINAQVTGSEIFDGYVAYNKAIGGSIMQIDRIVNAEFAAGTPEQKNDSNFSKTINDDFRKRITTMRKNQVQFAKDHPNSFFAVVALSEAGSINKANADEADSIFSAIDLKWRGTNFGKALAQKIEAARLVVAGEPAPLFTLAEANGKPLSLADLKGKVVLLDFWASWCEPCRAESPNLKTQYQLYKDKGFEILSISLDTEKKNWLKAISDDQLTWLQVSDLKGYNSDVVRSYGIGGVPSFFLIGKDGKIIANNNLQGSALNERLAEIFGH